MEIIKKLENEYINLKEHFNTRKKELYSYLYAKFLINEDSINELVKYSSLKENIIFNKNKKNDSEYSAGLYAGAEKQAINTVNKIISEYMKIHIHQPCPKIGNIHGRELSYILIRNAETECFAAKTQTFTSRALAPCFFFLLLLVLRLLHILQHACVPILIIFDDII